MKKKQLAILLSPRSVEAALIDSDHPVSRAAEPIPTNDQPTMWDSALTPADAPLESIIKQLDCAGAQTTVAYHSPTAFSEVFNCSTQGATFASAARLAMLDRVPFDVVNAQQSVAVWGEDPAHQDKRSHAIIAADTLQTSTTVASWIDRAGLNLSHATPVDATALAWMLDQLAKINSLTPTACIHIGDECSVLGFVRDNHILLARRVGLTQTALLDALRRPIMSGDDASQTLLDDQAAQDILANHGIPAPKDAIAENLMGRDVLPLLQPLLQRFVVETRQLFRFGVDPELRANAVLRVTGAGAQIPNLAHILAEHLEITLDEHHGASKEQAADLDICLHAWQATPNTAPPQTLARIQRSRFKSALLAGSILAAVITSIDAGLTIASTNNVSADANAISDKASSAESLLHKKQQAQTSRNSIDALRKAAIEHLSPQADFPAVLKEVNTLTPEWIRLSNITSTRSDEGLSLRIDGHALQNDPAHPPQIEHYIDAIKASPLISDVTLGATQATMLDRNEALRFSLELHIVSYPPTLSAAWEDAQ